MPEPSVGSQWDELYDQENDVYYVSFGTGEPSYCAEVDDILIVEVGLFSKLPTGYRILNRSKIKTHRAPMDEIKRRMSEVLRGLPAPSSMNDREAAVERSLDKVLA